MTDLTPEKRAEIREMLDAATDGPWVREWDTSDQWWTIHGQPNPAKGDDRMVCPEVATLNHREDWTSDADLIVAAVNTLPALLDAADERDRLAAQVERVHELHDDRAWECANPQHTNPSVGCPECRESCMSCGEDYPCATLRALDADA